MLSYCKKWSRRRKKMIEILSVEEAKELHNSKKPYAVFVQEDNQVDAFLEVNLGLSFVGSSLLDEHLREFITYSFQEQEEKEGQLFLSTVMNWEYPEDSSGDFIKSTRYEFGVDGKMFIEEVDLIEGFKETYEDTFDLDKSWLAFPKFGQYEEFLNPEKHLS